jgi:hypothetical protein
VQPRPMRAAVRTGQQKLTPVRVVCTDRDRGYDRGHDRDRGYDRDRRY